MLKLLDPKHCQLFGPLGKGLNELAVSCDGGELWWRSGERGEGFVCTMRRRKRVIGDWEALIRSMKRGPLQSGC